MAQMRILPIIALLAAFQLPAHAEEPLGRLFLTPEKREILDRQRALNVLESQTTNEEPEIRVNGLVRRSSGKRTTWINGQAQNDEDASTGIVALPAPQSTDKVLIESGSEPRKAVRVGETLDRGTRETLDPLGGGSITVHRRTPAAR